MDFGQFFRVLRARFKLVAAIFLVTLLTTILVSSLLPKKYSAGTTLIVDLSSNDPLKGGAALPPSSVQSYLATQVDILKSDRVTGRVISSLNLTDDPFLQSQWKAAEPGATEMRPWLAKYLLTKLNIDPSREGSTIALTFEGHDPAYTANVVNAFAQGYVDAVLDLRVEPAKGYASWFEQRTKAYREELEKAQARLSAFQQQSGIVASDERYDVENQRLADLSAQLVQLQSAAADGRSRSSAVQRGGESMPEVVGNQLIQTLKADLGRAEAKVEELSARLGDNHPQMQSAKAEVAGLRSRLNSEISKVTGSIVTSSNVNTAREGEIRAALEAQRSKVLKLKKDRDQIAVYQREVDSAQKALEIVSQRLTQTNLESQTRQSNVSILSQAVPPTEASRPKVLLNSIVGALAGLMIGVFAALTLELVQKPLRTSEDLMMSAGVPVLAVLPPSSSRRPQRLVGTTGPTMQSPTLRLGNN